MRSLLFVPSCLLCLVLLFPPSFGISEGVPDELPPATELQGQMVAITDTGLEPSTLSMSREERVAFFVNNSTDSLITLQVDFGSNTTHCASKNLEIRDNGTVVSSKPISPKDFATTCFHEAGKYPFTVRGVTGHPEGLKGTIVVD
jgi:hypothetical protein